MNEQWWRIGAGADTSIRPYSRLAADRQAGARRKRIGSRQIGGRAHTLVRADIADQ